MKNDAALVKASFEHVKPVADAAAMLLTERLFAVAPGTAGLFGDIGAAERAELMSTMASVVESIDDARALEPTLFAIGRYAAAHGLQPAHYDRFGDALIWSLSHTLGHRFTPEVKAAWTRVYTEVSGLMRNGARAAA
jgi:hemoglobin-like flavoprotein